MTEQEELEYLKQNSPMALPDDPSSSGWSAAQIKEKHYAGLFFLYNLFKANRENLNQAVSDMQEIVDSINEEYEEIINGKNVSAKWDDENNEIKTTYAKILNITNGTVKVLKYIKENGTDDYIYNIEKNLSSLTTNFNTLKAWTDNLKDINSDTSVLRAVQATKDGLGNIINETYATIASLTLVNSSISNIVNGTTIVGKAYNDQLGRRIDTTYIRIADIINVLNDTSTNKPLSAAMGKSLQDQINAINTLLASDDTDLDTIQEIITYIKNNKTLIENITSDKMSYSVLVHNLTTNNDNLPLSASMGYVLKGYIDTLNDAETGIQANEAQRILNENQRIANEEARQTGYSGFDSRITANTNAISGIKDGTNIDSFADVETALATKANTTDVYAKSEVYTKTETQALHTNTLEASKTYCDESVNNLRYEIGDYNLTTLKDRKVGLMLVTPEHAKRIKTPNITGGSVSFNQLVPNGNFDDSTGWNGTAQVASYSIANNQGTFVCNAQNGQLYCGITVKTHVYLAIAMVKTTTPTTSVALRFYGSNIAYTTATTNWQVLSGFMTVTSAGNTSLGIQDTRASDWDNIQVAKVMLFDVTQMFGTAITNYMITLQVQQVGAGVAWFRKYFPKSYYAYTTGLLLNVKTSGKKVVGFNQWDEQWELGAIDTSTGNNYITTTQIRSKNYINVLPNTTYYCLSPKTLYALFYDNNKNVITGYSTGIAVVNNASQINASTFITPSNCAYMRFYLINAYGTTYNNDICINISGYRNGEYESYEEATYPIEDVELRGFPRLDSNNELYFDGDVYNADGVVDIRTPYVDISTLIWTYVGNEGYAYIQNYSKANAMVISALPSPFETLYVANSGNLAITFPLNSFSSMNQFMSALSGVMAIIEPTTMETISTSSATPFQLVVDCDGGTQQFVDNRTIPMPVDVNNIYLIEGVKA